jgi:uncharacterized repeat protein (TIGR01451 family)
MRVPLRQKFVASLAIVMVATFIVLPGVPASAGPGEADLAIDLTAPLTTVAGSGTGFDYSITVDNLGDLDNVNGYTVTLPLPPGITFVTASGGCILATDTVSCTDTDGITAAGPPAPYTVHVTTDSDVVGNVNATATVAATTPATDITSGNNTDGATVNVTAEADLGIVKSAPDGLDPDLVVAGDSAGFDYTLTVGTSGPSDAGFSIQDTLAAGLTFQDADSDPACDAAGQVVTCSSSITAQDAPQTFLVHVLVDPAQPHGSILDNQASVSATGGATDPNDTNDDSNQVTTAITAHADLSLDVTGPTGDQVAGAGAGINYTYTVDNLGPSDNIGGFTITDTLPVGFSFVSSPDDCTGSGRGVTCEDPNNFAHDAAARDFVVHAKIAPSVAAGTVNDAAEVVSGTTAPGTIDPEGGNNLADVGVDVITRANLSITKSAVAQLNGPTFNLAYANASSSQNRVTFTIGVSNAATSSTGPSDAQSVTVTDTLPAGTTFVSANSGDCSGTSTVTCTNVAPLVPGASRSYTIVVSVNASLRGGETNNFMNTSRVSSTTVDINAVAYPKSVTSGTIRVHTVSDPPTAVTAYAGNGSAVVTWTPPVVNGGETVDTYTLTVDCISPNPCLEPGPYTGITGTQYAVGDDGTPLITNLKNYVFRVEAVNEVGNSDPSANSNTIIPSQDLSAEILGGANNLQQTGEGLASNADKFIGKQLKSDGSFTNGSIGTLVEIGSPVTEFPTVNPSTFCGPPPGLPCAGGEVLISKVLGTVPVPGRYIIEIDIAKGVAVGTGQKAVFFDPDPTNNTDSDKFMVPDCPKKGPIPTATIACLVKLVSQPANNPAVLLQISVKGSIHDPATGLRR